MTAAIEKDVIISAFPESDIALVKAGTPNGKVYMNVKFGKDNEVPTVQSNVINALLEEIKEKGLSFSFKKG